MQRNSRTFDIQPHAAFIKKCLKWCGQFEHFSYYNPNGYQMLYGPFEHVLGANSVRVFRSDVHAFSAFKNFMPPETWLMGYFSYDLKNEIEDLSSSKPPHIDSDLMVFFEPEHLFFFEEDKVRIESPADPMDIFKSVQKTELSFAEESEITLTANMSREEYLNKLGHIHSHIKQGNVYELNFCLEFTADNVKLDPVETYSRLMEFNPAPFSVLQKIGPQYLISASPERFLKKEGDRYISQPMKGTIRRGENQAEDKILITELQCSEKERAENMMIVDLVRNDLSRNAIPGSVNVEELFGISTFPTVHQMISTIIAEIEPSNHPLDVIRDAFPMGSMTGAPKIRAMKLIDQYERSSRGWYSGATGYFQPNGDFDFNVVIRSLVYDSDTHKLSYHAGSAITYDSQPEREYDECVLKAEHIMKLFSVLK